MLFWKEGYFEKITNMLPLEDFTVLAWLDSIVDGGQGGRGGKSPPWRTSDGSSQGVWTSAWGTEETLKSVELESSP